MNDLTVSAPAEGAELEAFLPVHQRAYLTSPEDGQRWLECVPRDSFRCGYELAADNIRYRLGTDDVDVRGRPTHLDLRRRSFVHAVVQLVRGLAALYSGYTSAEELQASGYVDGSGDHAAASAGSWARAWRHYFSSISTGTPSSRSCGFRSEPASFARSHLPRARSGLPIPVLPKKSLTLLALADPKGIDDGVVEVTLVQEEIAWWERTELWEPATFLLNA